MGKIVEFLNSAQGRRVGVMTLLLMWCLGLIAARFFFAKSIVYVFLVWNLVLALIPFFASTLLTATRRHSAVQGALFVTWLLFFPNAPYLLTDLIHLDPKPPVPQWYDLALLLSCAGTGLFLGYLSLLDIHAWVEARRGVLWGWMVAVGVLFLSGFGIYLGRFLRWNSWDVLMAPKRLFFDIVESLTEPAVLPRVLGVTALFGTVLILGYLATQVLAVSTRRCKTPLTAVPCGSRSGAGVS